MRHKILVIDDSYDEREPSYCRLTDACDNTQTAIPPSFHIDLHFAHNPWEIELLLRDHAFSAVILDVVLKNWKWREGVQVYASEILDKIDDNIPVALLSSEWVSEEVKHLVANWPTKNCRMFIHWEDIDDGDRVAKGSLTRVLLDLVKHIEDYRHLDYSVTLSDRDPICILHLSDLQFGGFNDWKHKLEAGHCATTIKKLWKEGPTFIVITGDIAERGLPHEYEAAKQWIAQLVSEFSWSLPSSRIFMVPGNHDVCLPFATSSLLTLQETDESKRSSASNPQAKKDFLVDFTADRKMAYDLTDYAFKPYLDFSAAVAPRQFLPPSGDKDRQDACRHAYAWLEARFRYLGVVFFGLNTSRPINPGILPNRKVPKASVEDITTEAQRIVSNCVEPPIFIGMTHYYPQHTKAEWGVDNPEDFEQLMTDVPRVALWLHGHWHKRETSTHSVRDGMQLVVNSAPSLTVRESHRPPDTARGFSMIELKREDNKVIKCTIFPVEFAGNTLQIRENEGRKLSLDKNGYFKVDP